MQKSTTNNSVLECEVCGFLARDVRDLKKIKSHGACYECYTNFYFTYGTDWDLGKRPTKEEAHSKMCIITKRGKNG